jgi:alpha-galactosidase
LDDVTLEEILSFTDFGEADRSAFLERKGLSIICCGWQSWSPSWEIPSTGSMPGPGSWKRFGVFIDRPGDQRRRGRVRSHFLICFRAGHRLVALVSRNSGAAPVGFEYARKSATLRIDLQSQGKERKAGDVLADLRVVWGGDWFSFKDGLKAAFAGFGHFERLAFLGARGAAKTVPGGWESWYNHYSDIREDGILRRLDALDDNDNFVNRYYVGRGKPTVFQVDDGWEIAVGDWDCDRERFPQGMKLIADKVRGKGFLPGIWIAPFLVTTISKVYHERPEWLLRDARGKPIKAGWIAAWGGYFHALDLSIPEVRAYLYGLFDKLVDEWGYRYLKLDFLYAGMLEGVRRGGGAAYEWYEEVVGRITSRLRNADGRPLAWLGCGAPVEPSFRHFPLMRVGADTRESWDYPAARLLRYPGRPSAIMSLRDVIGRALLDGTALVSDPDVFFLRSERCRLSRNERELIALADFMFGSQLMISDDVHEYPRGDEASMTDRVIGLFDRLEGREWGVERLAKDVFRVFSRSGDAKGIINLRSGSYGLKGAEPFDVSRPIVGHFKADRGKLSFERRSISLFEADPPAASSSDPVESR